MGRLMLRLSVGETDAICDGFVQCVVCIVYMVVCNKTNAPTYVAMQRVYCGGGNV